MKSLAGLAVLLVCAGCGDDGSSNAESDGSSSEAPASTEDPSTTEPQPNTTSGADASSTGSDAPVTTDTPGSCSGTCAPEIPNGWTGPVKAGGNAVDCNGGFAAPAGAFFTDFEAGEKECTCECGLVEGGCAEMLQVQFWGDESCAGEPDYVASIDATVCSPFEGPFAEALDDKGGATPLSMDFVTIAPVTIEGTCGGEPTFNEGGFGGSIQLCGPTAAPSMCDEGGPCIADNTDVCIWQEGEHACPDGYPETIAAFSGSDDERECGACDCGTPQGVCDSSVTLQTDACDGGLVVTNADCENTGAAAVFAGTYDPGAATVSCGGSGTAPLSGTAAPTGPVTICCAE